MESSPGRTKNKKTKMTDSKYFTTTKKGEIFELKSELNNDKKEKKKEAVKKVKIIKIGLKNYF